MYKLSDLLPDVALQEHQQKVLKKLKEHPGRMLLYHGLGSGKSLSSIAAAEQEAQPYTSIAPASLRENFKKEQEKFTNNALPSAVMSYSALGRGNPVKYPQSLIFDEAHRLRNPDAKQTVKAIAAAHKADQALLLTGTPITNYPSDFAPLMSMLTDKYISPDQFNQRYIKEIPVHAGLVSRILGRTPGIEEDLSHEEELKSLLSNHIDYYKPKTSPVPTQHEDIVSEMSGNQADLYRAMFNKLPFWLRWKLRANYPLSHQELRRLTSFLVGPREASLSTLPFQRSNANPITAFNDSPKLQTAVAKLHEVLDSDPRTKALVFSNFINAGLRPYAAALERDKIPYGIFHGGLSDVDRKNLIEAYNNGTIRTLLLGPSGSEGLSAKGTQLVQILDEYWHPERGRQSEGRGIRYDSHWNLPEELQNVRVQRFISRLPLTLKDKLLSFVGFDREAQRLASDDYLRNLSERKDKLNQKFLKVLQNVGSQ